MAHFYSVIPLMCSLEYILDGSLLMKHAMVNMRGAKVFVRSMDKTVAGTHIIQDDVVTLRSDDLNGIASAVKAALQASQAGVPIPPRGTFGAQAPGRIYAEAGVRSWREFVKGAKAALVKCNEGEITIIPWRNLGARDGFVPMKDCDRIVQDPADLGAAVMAALADAE